MCLRDQGLVGLFEGTRQQLTGSSFGGLFTGSPDLFRAVPVGIAVHDRQTALSLTRNDYELRAVVKEFSQKAGNLLLPICC